MLGRRDFLRGISAAAVSAVLPAPSPLRPLEYNFFWVEYTAKMTVRKSFLTERDRVERNITKATMEAMGYSRDLLTDVWYQDGVWDNVAQSGDGDVG